MDKLKGSGASFSTSGKAWKPFRLNRKVATQNAKRHTLIRNGFAPLGDKASLRQAAQEACAAHPIKRID